MNLEAALGFASTLDGVVISTAFDEPAARLGADGPVVMFTQATKLANQVSLKLDESRIFAATLRGVRPMGHGLGPHGWVTIDLATFETEPDVVTTFIEESYACARRRS